MADSTTNLEQIDASQAENSVTANQLFDAASPAMIFGRHAEACIGLVWGGYGGRWGGDLLPNWTVDLEPSAENFIVMDRANGDVLLSGSGTDSDSEWSSPDLYGHLYIVTTDADSVVSYEDHRAGPDGVIGDTGVSGSYTSPTTTKGDLIVRGASADARLAVGTDGQIPVADSTQPLGIRWATASVGSLPGSGWAQYLAASLEPDAIEGLKRDGFSYAVASNVTKLLIASWATQIGTSGRMELRDPGSGFVPLRGVTLTGIGSGSAAVIINPALPTYADAWATYYERLQEIVELQTRSIAFGAASEKQLLLPGPFGSIITQYTVFDLPWLCVRPVGGTVIGYNLGDEESDTDGQRVGRRLMMPVNKNTCSAVHADDTADGSPAGGVLWVNCPSTWSAIADPNTYAFRDTFEAATLDTGVWSVTQSTAGNIAINTTYNWLQCKGNNAWGNNAVFKTTGIARSTDPVLIVDFATPFGSDFNGAGCVGWHDGAGAANTDMLHGVNISAKAGGTGAQTLTIQEGGTNKSTGGVTVTEGSIYRLRITALAAGGATYEIQGGTEFQDIGGASWTTLSPSGGSSGSAATLHPGMASFGFDLYLGDMRVI